MNGDGINLAAPVIFILVALLQFVPRYLEQQIRNGAIPTPEEMKLRTEIKQHLKEASTLTQPSTFAQAAKLRRMAAAKEKELAKHQEQQMLERKSLYDPYMKYVTPVKALTYLLLAVWFWKSPVASIPKELIQPFGKVLSWKSGGSSAPANKVVQHRFYELIINKARGKSGPSHAGKVVERHWYEKNKHIWEIYESTKKWERYTIHGD